jgi:rare lipoprotein A (peptidoglycan hydrolase)
MRNARNLSGCAAAVTLLVGLLAGPAAAAAAGERARAAAAEPYYTVPLGTRELRRGNRGTDVKTLNWALRSELLPTPYYGTFDGDTDTAVRALQRSAGLPASGVVARPTMKAIAAGMPRRRASWYGPGLWGRRTACGVRLKKRTIGVAHRKLPCGTRVALAYKGNWVRAEVIDRGPYRKGFGLDLTRRLAEQLGVVGLGRAKVKVGVVP